MDGDADDEDGAWRLEPTWPAGVTQIPNMAPVQLEGVNRCLRRVRTLIGSPMRGVWLRREPGSKRHASALCAWALWRMKSGELGVGRIGYVPKDVAVTLAEISKNHEVAACLLTLRDATKQRPAAVCIVLGWKSRTPSSRAKPAHRAPVTPRGCMLCPSCHQAIEGTEGQCDLCGAPL
jgi:hypothetical protein